MNMRSNTDRLMMKIFAPVRSALVFITAMMVIRFPRKPNMMIGIPAAKVATLTKSGYFVCSSSEGLIIGVEDVGGSILAVLSVIVNAFTEMIFFTKFVETCDELQYVMLFRPETRITNSIAYNSRLLRFCCRHHTLNETDQNCLYYGIPFEFGLVS